MILVKTTEQILSNPWINVGQNTTEKPKTVNWNYDNGVSIFDISLWETIFFQPGNIGIYAAWDPYIEYYILTNNLFLGSDAGFLEFYGAGSCEKIMEKCKELRIELSSNRMWVEEKDLWLYQ